MKKDMFEAFTKSVANHELTIRLDNDLYRHITLKKPTSSDLHYHITTWPGYLSISGDMGCFVFSRVQDMFAFFRGSGDEINPHYWSEKLQAPKYNDKSVLAWSPSKVKTAVNQLMNDWVESAEEDGLDEEFIQEQKGKAIDLIRSTDDEFEFTSAVWNFDADDNGINFNEFFYETTTTEFTYNYIWCCYAIVHAINAYDEYKSKQEAA